MGIGAKLLLCLLLLASTFLAIGSSWAKSDVPPTQIQTPLPIQTPVQTPAEFCGNSTFAECKEDSDCKIGGYSGEI
ncbi:MAG: hypothetical protein ACK401_02040 [Archaeoglobaceae archaeon]